MDNFDDILRKAMEAEQQDDKDARQLADDFIGILSMGKMMQLGHAAKDKLDEVFNKLTNDLQEYSKMDSPSYHAHATMAVKRAADEIKILNTIVSACAISGVDSVINKSEDMTKTLETILRTNTMR